MNITYIPRSLLALAALLMTLSFLDSGTATPNNSIFLVCHPASRGGQVVTGLSIYLTIDYRTETVVTSELNVTKAVTDAEGRTAQPAQISESQITWKIGIERANGRIYAEHFTLNRLTGNLGIYDDGFSNTPRLASQSWVCEAGEEPTPRF